MGELTLEGRPLYGLCRPLQDTKKPTPSLPFSRVSTINCFYFYVSTPTLLYAELVAEPTCITPPFLLTDNTDDDFTTLRWRQKWCGMKRSLLRDWHWKCCFSFVCFAKRLLHCKSHVQLSHRHVAIVQDFTAVFCFSVDTLSIFGVKKYSLVLWCNYRYVQICGKCRGTSITAAEYVQTMSVCVQYTGSQVYSTTILLASTP